LDNIDVLMEDSRETVTGGANHGLASLSMFPNMIFSVKHLLNETDWEPEGNPVLGRRSNYLVLGDTECSKPLVHRIQTLLVRSNELFNLGFREVLAITFVVRIADLIEMLLKDAEIWLGETYTKDNFVVWRRYSMLNPGAWRLNSFLNAIGTVFDWTSTDERSSQ